MESDCAFVFGSFDQFPFLQACKTVSGMACERTEPRQDNRNATANRRVVLEVARFTHEQHRWLTFFLEVSDVCAVQIYLSGAPVAIHGDFGQTTVASG